MKKHNFIALLIAALMVQACQNSKSGANDNQSESDTLKESTVLMNESSLEGDAAFFAKKAAAGGLMEVEAGKVAMEKSKNASVTSLAEMIVSDHTKANEELKGLASEKKIVLPTELDSNQKSHLDKLKSLSGNEFDQTYLNMMSEDHRKDIQMFEDASKNLRDKDVRNFASKTLPVLKKHAEAVDRIKLK